MLLRGCNGWGRARLVERKPRRHFHGQRADGEDDDQSASALAPVVRALGTLNHQ